MTVKKARKYLITLFALMLVVFSTITNDHVSANSQKGLQFSDPINLGSPIESVAIYDSTYGNEDGRDVMYTTVTGNPAIFQVVDLASKEVLRTFSLEGSESSWTHITVPNGAVYIGGNGNLYEYSPVTKELKNLGGIGESVVYGLSYDEEGRVYFGSYPNAKAGRYDPKTGEMKDYGSVAPGQNYSRSTAYHDGYLYLGIGIDGHLVKLDVETGEFEKIELPEAAIAGSTNIWQLDTAGKYIVAGIGGGNNALLFYDTELEEWSEKYYQNNKGLRLIQGKPGEDKAYFLQGARLQEINLATLDITDTGVVFGTFLRNTAWVEVSGDADLPGLSLVTVQFGGQVSYMNLETKKVKSTLYPIVGNPIPIQTLEKGPDGNLYVSGYPGGKAAVYNPTTHESQSFSLGQAEGMASLGNNMYFGVYPGASIFEMDVTKPVENNLKQIYKIPNQDRPFMMTPIDNKIYIGTIPNYGELGGSLTVLDPTSIENTVVYENVIYNQSIVGLAEKDGKVYGSTTVDGGLGIVPTEDAAKLFVWDIDKGEVIEEFVPNIPGVSMQPRRISGMSLGPDGLIWGAADGTIFAMNPETLEIEKHNNIYPEVKDRGRWRTVHLRFGEDGFLYTTLAGKITVINPETLESYKLASTELMTLGEDGHIYYAQGPYLMKVEVSEADPVITLDSLQAQIESLYEEKQMPHSLYKQISNQLKQVRHHEENGQTDQAQHHLTVMKKHVEKWQPDELDAKQALLNSIDSLRQ